MMCSIVPLALVLALGGCTVTATATREPVVEDVYSRADVDAINSDIQCRSLARNTVQASRCGVRR